MENDMKRLRVGVVGVGHLGQHHARILSAMSGVELVAVADARSEQAQAIAAKCGTVALNDYRPLLELVDAVTIAVPTCLHGEVAGAFLEKGIATLVEKPMTSSLAESEQLVAQARAAHAVLQVGHIERFNPALQALEGLAVRPKFVNAERLSTYTFRSTDIGVVFDLMIHDLDLLLSLIAAPVRSVSAVGVSLFGEHEDVANARIEFEDGSVANLTASRASYTPSRKMRIWGAEGYASLDFAAKEATVIRPSEQLKRDAARGLARPRVSGDDALRAVRLADQVLRSLEAHRWDADSLPLPTVAPTVELPSVLRGPHSWRTRTMRQTGTTNR
jgi:predicted dehydrogenase